MVRDVVGGIFGALTVLRDHWGAVGRDLADAHYRWDDICTDVLPLDQFIAFVLYAPPGTAVFHVVNDGWDATTHKVSDLIQWVKVLISMGTADPQKAFDALGADQRPGMEPEVQEPQHITIGEYMRLAGMDGGDSA